MDLRNTRARLKTLALAIAIGAVMTFFTVKAMLSSGPAPNTDPVGGSTVGLLAIFVFVISTMFASKVLSKKRAR